VSISAEIAREREWTGELLNEGSSICDGLEQRGTVSQLDVCHRGSGDKDNVSPAQGSDMIFPHIIRILSHLCLSHQHQ